MRNGMLYNLLRDGYKPTALSWFRRSGSLSLIKRIHEIRRDQEAGKLPGRILTVPRKTRGGAIVAEYHYIEH